VIVKHTQKVGLLGSRFLSLMRRKRTQAKTQRMVILREKVKMRRASQMCK
jgi:hypothetical protein